MKFHDALLAGSDHGTDRLPVEIDRRLRRRLGLESARSVSPRRVWVWPAMGAFAAAAIALAVIYLRPSKPSDQPQRVAAGFVDISKSAWTGTVTGNEVDVHADSVASATVKWQSAEIVAAPGTHLSTSADSLVLAHGGIRIQRTDKKPMSVVIPMGRVVIGSYRSSVVADLESVTILIDDGTGQYIDGDGQSHPLVPGTLLVWPPARGARDSAPGASPPAPVPPPQKHSNGRSTVRPGPGSSATDEHLSPPGLTPPSVPRRPDVPCTFKSDCDPGATCRENERGESVCMGNGGEDAACWFDNDCLSQHCAGRRCEAAPTTP